MLRNNHEKVKKLILLYFYVYEMQCIPLVSCKAIDTAKLMIVPVFLAFSAFCNIWHFLYEVKSADNILDISINTNLLIGGIQTIFTVAVVNVGLKWNHNKVQKYFDNIVESSEVFLTEAREEFLSKSLQIANSIVRAFLTVYGATCLLFPAIALYQTNYVSPIYYQFPGLPHSSPFFYPVNIIGQILIFTIIIQLYISMDCLFFIYLFYFRGEIHSITAVAKLLSQKEHLDSNCDRILRSIYRAHREVFKNFGILSKVMWHFYSHKMLAMIFIICCSLFIYSQTNSIASGIILQMLAISLLVILCVPGQLIDSYSDNLRETLYESLWYEMKPLDQRNFLLIFIGSQKNINAETFGVGVISFATFVQVIKLAISYAAFVYAVLL
ncbi:hypothetical protein DMENIID0001_054640 [Sergentomyia squamirostris]